MKKLTLALLLIIALCVLAVSPVVAADPYTNSIGNVTAKYTIKYDPVYKINQAVVTFPTATYRSSIGKTLDATFVVPSMPSIRTSTGGYPYVAKFPWEL